MLVCLDCGNIFFEDDIEYWEEHHGLDHGPYECCSGCPRCGGAYTETYRCNACGEWITDNYIKVDDMRFCDNCFYLMELGDE